MPILFLCDASKSPVFGCHWSSTISDPARPKEHWSSTTSATRRRAPLQIVALLRQVYDGINRVAGTTDDLDRGRVRGAAADHRGIAMAQSGGRATRIDIYSRIRPLVLREGNVRRPAP